ncbi:MAG: hypothetical protein ABJ075_09610, partial [Nonlabens ulvanivorans]
MAQQKDNRIFKVLLAVLLLGIIVLGVWSYTTYQENEGIKVALNDEKAQIQKELENISTEYSIEIDKGNALNADLVDARDRITRLVDSVGKLETDVRVLSRMRTELSNIRKERDLLQDRI